jgi:hypothetical protein
VSDAHADADHQDGGNLVRAGGGDSDGAGGVAGGLGQWSAIRHAAAVTVTEVTVCRLITFN